MRNHSHRDKPLTLVLLVNLGSPSAPTRKALRAYLREFLSDRRVVEVPRIFWWWILHLIIVPLRSPRVAKLYASIFTEKGAPLVVGTEELTKELRTRLQAQYPDLAIDYAMRYGAPSLGDKLNHYQSAQVSRLVIVPLYPQYAASTVGSVFDQVARVMMGWRWVPDIRFIGSYHDYLPYLHALAKHIKDLYQPDHHLIMSFHGIPLAMLENGDPYYCQCHKTARLLADLLKLQQGEWQMTFQSRFGKQPWLQPYMDKVLEALPAQGITKVQVVCPGFTIDCLETLEEIATENRLLFLAAGGESYTYIPCLNDSQLQVDALQQLVGEQLQAWCATDSKRMEVLPDEEQHTRYRASAITLGVQSNDK